MSTQKTLQQITDETNEFIKSAEANYEAAVNAGTDVSKSAMETKHPESSESPVSEEAKATDPEVKQIAPDTGATTQPGPHDGKPTGESVAQPTAGSSSPAPNNINPSTIGGDCDTPPDTKTGGAQDEAPTALGQSILDQLTAKRAEAEKAAVESQPETPEEPKQAAAQEPTPAQEPEEPVKQASEEPVKDEEGAEKKAQPFLKLDNSLLAKIAECVLATEEGWDFAEQAVMKQAGASAATELLDTVCKQAQAEDEALKIAAANWDQGAADAEALILKAAETLNQVPELTEEQRKVAAADWEEGAAAADALIKAAMDPMVMAAGDAAGADMLPPEQGAGELAPEEAIAAAGDMAAEDTMTPEEVAAVLEEAVQQGLLDPAMAEEVLANVTSMTAAEAAPAELMEEAASAAPMEEPAPVAPEEPVVAEESTNDGGAEGEAGGGADPEKTAGADEPKKEPVKEASNEAKIAEALPGIIAKVRANQETK